MTLSEFNPNAIKEMCIPTRKYGKDSNEEDLLVTSLNRNTIMLNTNGHNSKAVGIGDSINYRQRKRKQ